MEISANDIFIVLKDPYRLHPYALLVIDIVVDYGYIYVAILRLGLGFD